MTTYVINNNSLSKSYTKLSKSELIIILFIGLYSANFLNKGVGITFLLLPFVLWKLLGSEITKRVMLASSILMIFSVYYATAVHVYGFSESNTVIAGYLISPIVMYWIGYIIIKKESRYKISYWLILSVIISTVLFSVLSIYRTILIYGSLENASPTYAGRAVMSLWGENFLSATGMNTYVSLGIALAPILFFIKDNTIKRIKSLKFMMFIFVVLSLYVSLSLANRTGLLILVASFITIYLLTARFNVQKMFLYLIASVPVSILGVLLFFTNAFGVREKWEGSSVGQRFQNFSAFDDPRFTAWGEAFKGMFQNPLGGRKTDISLTFAHNLWLDVGHDAGIVPFLLLVIFSVLGMFSLFRFLRQNHSLLLKGLILSCFTAITVTFFLEPIMQGWFYYFTIYCLLLGVVHKHIKIRSNDIRKFNS